MWSHEGIHDLYIDTEDKDLSADFSDVVIVEGDKHGRVDQCRCRVSQNLKGLGALAGKWSNLKSLIVVESEKTEAGKKGLERRIYISSRVDTAEYFLTATRKHWHIENKQHWVLDVAFREDDSRHRMGYWAENLAVLRHISLNVLKNEKTETLVVKNKRLRAGWDTPYLAKALSGLAI